MAMCILCGGFSLSATICAMCANTVPASRGWGTGGTFKPAAADRSYFLQGKLSGLVYDKQDKSFFDTVVFAKDGGLETIWNGRTAYHRTRPHANFTVVYTRDAQDNALIIGTGSHSGSNNKKYSIVFDTGSEVTCTRT